MTNTLALLGFTVMLAAGQLLFKKVGLDLKVGTPAAAIHRILAGPEIYAALVLYGIATLLWIWILSRVPLSRAYPYVALGVVLVPVASIIIFGEQVRVGFWLGTLLIVAGIIITQLSFSQGP